jgi:hypothetical protein
MTAKRADAAADVSTGEREAVYEAVVGLVRARLEKAQSLKNVTLQNR